MQAKGEIMSWKANILADKNDSALTIYYINIATRYKTYSDD